ERELINSHAQATRRILSKIPWTKELRQIPHIACHHHEKIDGSGYPDGLKGDEICLESKILAVVDIYEALVAQDRPYKPRMPAEKAVAILRAEARSGHLDNDIVEFFVNKGLHSMFLHEVG
ncbi:MAG: HD domain-containing protein, partial [Chitinivibrionales bacterium]|nr:HD domain-containing protein [Chitinivibrionales bacterium]